MALITHNNPNYLLPLPGTPTSITNDGSFTLAPRVTRVIRILRVIIRVIRVGLSGLLGLSLLLGLLVLLGLLGLLGIRATYDHYKILV